MAVTVIEVNKQTYPVHTGIHSREPILALHGRGHDLDHPAPSSWWVDAVLFPPGIVSRDETAGKII